MLTLLTKYASIINMNKHKQFTIYYKESKLDYRRTTLSALVYILRTGKIPKFVING